ncbi:zinc knuckle CX2CX4HX4C containing protein [Tanacetum coccineum]
MEKSDKLNVRDGTTGIQGVGTSGASCNGSIKVSNPSPLVSPTAPINMPRGLYNVDVAVTFGVPLTTVGDLDMLTKGIEASKHEELLSRMTSDKCKAVMDALVAMCDSVQATNTNADAIPCMVLHEGCGNGSTRFANTLYGYFIGKRIAFPVVEYYVRNNWGKYGLTRIMMNSKGFFFFQFKTLKGLEDVLENGPWMIRNSPIILKKWSMSTHLCKEELIHIPVWVKIHDVPIQVFSEDGLRIIASQIGKPIMLDSYTSSMCIESWGRSSFARCLIEINAEDVLKESLTIGVPLIEDTGFTIETITIEYEWKPPRCDLCKIFGHVHDHFPKKVSIPITVVTPNVHTPTVEMTNDGILYRVDGDDFYENCDELWFIVINNPFLKVNGKVFLRSCAGVVAFACVIEIGLLKTCLRYVLINVLCEYYVLLFSACIVFGMGKVLCVGEVKECRFGDCDSRLRSIPCGFSFEVLLACCLNLVFGCFGLRSPMWAVE